MTCRIVRCSYADIKHLNAARRKEGVTDDDKPGMAWFGIYVEGEPKAIGCGGLLKIGSSARMKGDFVLPQYRGNGFATRMLQLRLSLGRELGCANASAFCSRLNTGIFKAAGFRSVSISGETTFMRLPYGASQ
jgi:RimJ/RimL family protein N-acetyltransferase